MREAADKLRERIHFVLKEHNLTVHGWTKKAGLSEASLRTFLKGNTQSLSYHTLIKLAHSLDKPLGYVVGEEEIESSNSVKKTDINEAEKGLHKLAYSCAQDAINKEDKNVDPNDLAWDMLAVAKQYGKKSITVSLAAWLLDWKY